MFLLVPAYPGCPRSKAVKRSLLLLLLDNHFTLLCRGCPPALSMSVSRKVVRCTIQLYHEKKDELRIQPSVDSSNETIDTDSPATTNPGVKQLLLMVLK